jgi:hypothetical protein
MTYHIILDNQQQLHIIPFNELDIALARGFKELYSGNEKECEKEYDDLCDEWGYTGPIWDKLELNFD